MGNGLQNLVDAVGLYDPDQDIETTGGSGGMRLADAINRATRGNPITFGKVVARDRRINYLKSLMEITRRRVVATRDLHSILWDLRKKGYDVPAYGDLNHKKSKKLVLDIRGKIAYELDDLLYQESLEYQLSFR